MPAHVLVDRFVAEARAAWRASSGCAEPEVDGLIRVNNMFRLQAQLNQTNRVVVVVVVDDAMVGAPILGAKVSQGRVLVYHLVDGLFVLHRYLAVVQIKFLCEIMVSFPLLRLIIILTLSVVFSRDSLPPR